MIADQDYLQVWANAMRMGNCTELNWRWNHCPQWDDNFPHPNALVIHLSNFCNGPTLEAITALKKYRSIPISDGEVHPQIIESKKLPISFVVVTYNSDNVISTCLSAVEQCQPAEIIVIDNGSTDNTLNLLAKLTVNVIHNSTNMGFASAANRGAMAATQPNLCFLNPDAEMTVEVARLAIERLMLEREIALVPDYLNTHGMVISGVQPGYSRRKLVGDMLDPTPKLSGAYRRLIRDSGHDHSWTWPLAACLFMSKNYFQSLGGFNEKYFCYMEDVALGQLISGGTGVVESLGKTVVHAGGKGSNVGTEQRRLVLDSARIAYAQSEYGRPFALLLRGLRRGVMFISRSRLNREATIS
jgi:GT2 family glycosyltransferase